MYHFCATKFFSGLEILGNFLMPGPKTHMKIFALQKKFETYKIENLIKVNSNTNLMWKNPSATESDRETFLESKTLYQGLFMLLSYLVQTISYRLKSPG